MRILSTLERERLSQVANDLNINYNDLYDLINFESGFNPTAKNPYSSARGLIQFIDSTARELGFNDSLHLVETHPTVYDQLQVVYEYLVQFYPFENRQDLFMSVFYPKFRGLDAETEFPDSIKNVNPGIETIQDYMNFVDSKKKLKK